MSPLNETNTTFSQKEDIRAALDEEVKAPIEDGADKVKLQPEVEEKEDETEETTDDTGEKRTKKSLKEEEELKAKLGVEEDEEEKEEEVDTDAELVAPVRFKEVLKVYPELDKKFPYLKVAYYRDQQFTEQFSTPSEAKEAREILQEFDGFRQDLLNGNMTSVLKTVREADPNAFAKVVDNVLQAVADVDAQAYYHILGNQTAAMILSMRHQAKATNNQDLQTAANILQQFMYGTVGEVQPRPFAKQEQPNQQQSQLEQERLQFAQERFNSFATDIDNKVGNKLRALIETNIDDANNPKMTPYIKEKAINDCFNELARVMQNDPAYIKQKGQAWERAVRSNFSQEALNTIQTIAINKGKLSLSKIILKVRNEALKGLGANTPRERTREPITPGRSTSSSNSGKKAPDVPKGISTRDYFDMED